MPVIRFLTAMLHDIGTPEATLRSTRLSYEFYAGIHAMDILQDARLTLHHTAGAGGAGDASEAAAPREQAESVVEAIIRHQDVQDKGNITLVTRLIHIGTLLDNIGAGKDLVSDETVKNIVAKWPRDGQWTGCFKGTVELEKKEKPYAMVSRIEGFEEMIEKNTAKGGPFEGLE
jgi:cyanamide hydratase